MTKISKSQNRFQLQKISYLERMASVGEQPEPAYLEMFDLQELTKRNEEADVEWQKNNLEYDLRTTDWILAKARSNETYAQNLYAALCNNEFQKHDAWLILKNESCGYSWRYSGGIIADMLEKGDYLDWYCSGTGGSGLGNGDEEGVKGYVGEGVVTEEIEQDLNTLGWIVVPYKEDE